VLLRDIERNPLRAGLVERAEDWPWSSLHQKPSSASALIRLDPGPAPRGEAWVEAVNAPMFDSDVAQVRESIRRDRSLGDLTWTLAAAKSLGLVTSPWRLCIDGYKEIRGIFSNSEHDRRRSMP
jgi:putative transposase